LKTTTVQILLRRFAAVITVLWGTSLCVHAAITNVTVESFDFVPDTVTIKVNDSVKWVWTGNDHSSTSSDGLWNSGLHNTGFLFTNKFTTAGSFPYFCTAHTFMVGTVTVQTTNSPPTVALINPPNGSVFSAPATIQLSATASDPGGSVTNVQFFQGAASLGNKSAAPWSLFASNLPAGPYAFSAVASDNTGLKATNGISVSVVAPNPITLANPRRLSGPQFSFNYSANAGLRYVIERSGSLSNFTPLATNTAAASSVTYTDSAPALNNSFYRVGRLPNP
jgi:plastocyanin